MYKKLFFLLCYLFITSFARIVAQGLVNVSPLTGAANVSIPIYTITNGQVSVPLSIVYAGAGIKARDVESTAGMGWNLNFGGQVTRVVRGLPDDCFKDNAGMPLVGWIGNITTTNAINHFVIANNGSTCTNETADINYINSNFPINVDTEPDMFYVNAPGLSCQLVYDQLTGSFRPVNYQDLIISYNITGGSGNNSNSITSFTITDDKGTKYVFAAPENVTQKTTLGSGSATYLPITYNRYQNGITYADNWNLTSITDANGNGVVFNYTAMPVRNSTDPIILFLNASPANVLQYNILQAVTSQAVTSIGKTNVNNPGSTILFNLTWTGINNNGGYTGQSIVSTITGMNVSYQFNYSGVQSNSSSFYRYFLRNFTENSDNCQTLINYQFSYLGETKGTYGYSTTLPDSSSKQIDYWGYYSTNATGSTLMPSVYVASNPSVASYPRYLVQASASPGADYTYSLLGNNRAVDPANVMVGSLSNITYVQGGSTSIAYESNDYFDAPSNTVVKGGGIRVKQVVDIDNVTNTSITHNYSYTLPGSAMSSGKPLSLPQFAFTVPYSGSATGANLWTACTALSGYDLSTENHTIMYSRTQVSQTGAGSTVYNYAIPATCWDVSASPICSGCSGTEWNPTVNEVGRTNCSQSYGPLVNTIYSYPFIPNPNYDFEQGLPISIVSYNDAGNEVAETDYTYQRSSNPSVITAFKSDDNGTSGFQVKAYNKYPIFVNTGELISTITKKVFDSQTVSQIQTSSIAYTYGSPNHKRMTREQVTNSDNSVSVTNISYVKDLTAASSGGNANVNALYNLQQENINVPIESYKQVINNGTTLTTGANLSIFSASNNGTITNYLPSQQLSWVQPNGAAFTPLSVNSTSLNYDPGYFTVRNFDSYDNAGYLLTYDDGNKNFATVMTDHLSNQLTAVFSNARYNEIAFNDFDSQWAAPSSTFIITGTGSYTPVGSHAGNAAGITNTQTISSGTLSLNSNSKNYIFSIWINPSAAGAGVLTLNIPGVSPSPTINYSTGGWNYHELKIPAANLPGSFNVSFTASNSISIDDILFYPDVSEVSTTTYDAVQYHKIAETNTNGISSYYQNDSQGKVLYKFDQDKNIIQRNTYVMPNQNIGFTPVISSGTPGYANTPISFYISGITSCNIGGTTVTWTFGDGSSAVQNTLSITPTHTYSATGSYTVTAVVTSPLFGSKTTTSTVIVNPQPVVSLSYTHSNVSAGSISSVTFTPTSPGGTSYSFTGAQLSTAKVLIGSYYVVVTLTGVQTPGRFAGNWAIYLKGDCTIQNQQYTTSGSHNFNVTLSNCTALNFTLTTYVGP